MKWASSGYIISSFIFFIGITVRICAWLIRPATHQVMKRSLKNLRKKSRKKRNVRAMLKTAVDNIILQKFIFKRGWYRGLQHFFIAWGCLLSLAITFGLVFNWFYFDLVDPQTYQIIVLSIPTITMHPDGFLAFISYNALNFSSIMLLVGLIMAISRRINNHDTKVTQRAEFDLFPLYLLLAVTVSGLLLTLSYKFLGGFMHSPMALVHQATVVIFLVYFPFGKLFHLPIRPMATSVPMNYWEEEGADTRPCKKCGDTYSNDDQIADVKEILGQQAFDLQMEDGTYLSDYCPACRRRIRVMTHLNMDAPIQGAGEPVMTNNGIHMPGFGRERDESFYNKKETEES